MKRERKTEYGCDECNKNITDKAHLRIFIGFTSGWMAPPFIGGKPVRDLCDRSTEFHFCKPECFTLFFNRKMHEIIPNTAGGARRARSTSKSGRMLAPASSEGSRLSRETDVGARNDIRREARERALGDYPAVRVFSFGRSIPRLRDIEQGGESMDRAQPNPGLGGLAPTFPAFRLAAKTPVPKPRFWSISFFVDSIKSVLP